MSQTPALEEVMQRIRANLNRRQSGTTTPWNTPIELPSPPPNSEAFLQAGVQTCDLSPLRTEIDGALQGHQLVGQVNPRKPGIHNHAIQFVKRGMARSLTWYTRPLHYFQGSVIRALQQIVVILKHHDDSLQRLTQELGSQAARIEQRSELASRQVAITTSALAAANQRAAALVTRVATLEEQATIRLEQSLLPYSQRLAGITDDIERLRADLAGIGNDLHESRLESRTRDRDLRRYFHDIQVNSPAASQQRSFASKPASVPTPPMFPSGVGSESGFDYFLFEERYRGDESLIATRQKEYLEYFRGRQNVVDIGCGRGEFLELLRDNGITGKGVELGTDQYLLCREKNLDVVQQDLFTYLESVPDESVGGLFSAQVIEHLSASDQLRFVSLAHQKTSAGSPVIFETINAQCVFAVMRNFFIDPTHIRPVHPETLKFAMESVKFHGVELRFSSPMIERQIPPLKLNGDTPQVAEFNRAIEWVNELLYGFMDYAAIGWR